MPIREIVYEQAEEKPEENPEEFRPPIVQTKKEARKEAEEFLTLQQASKECGMSRGIFKKLVELSDFPMLKVGPKIRLVRRMDLDRWLRAIKSVFN